MPDDLCGSLCSKVNMIRSRGLHTFLNWALLSAVLLSGRIESSEEGNRVAGDKPSSLFPVAAHLGGGKSKRPILQPRPSPPPVGTYSLTNPEGKICMKAVLGVEFMVIVKKRPYFFNMDPRVTRTSGYCGNLTALLSLEFTGGSLEFTFSKEVKTYYTRRLRAVLEPTPVCKGCKNLTFPGILDHENLFKTTRGMSFKCKSDLEHKMASDLTVKIVPAQFQPFDLAKGKFGKDFECWEDYIKRILPIIIGAVAVGICLIAISSYLVIREYRHHEYQNL